MRDQLARRLGRRRDQADVLCSGGAEHGRRRCCTRLERRDRRAAAVAVMWSRTQPQRR
jgi:hypothetical protein